MKKIAIILAAFAVSYSARAADDTVAASKPAYTVSTDFTYASEYVFRGQKNSNAAFQASAEVGYKEIYGGVWTNQPLRSGENNEVDLYIGYGFPLQNDWKIDTGLYSYNYPETATLGGNTGLSTYESFLGLTGGQFRGFTPSVYTYYDWKLDVYTLEGSVGYSFPIKQIGTSINVAMTYGYTSNTGSYGSNHPASNYWGAGVSIPYQLAPNAKLTGGLQYAGNDEDLTGYGESYKLYYTIGLTLGF
ncbi:MAG: TorF family putative porin [Opitutaceae bacterium]|jgi:uncharacterized protein (TIGR02001 family)